MLGCLLSGPLALHVTESSSTFPTSLFALSSILLSFAATLSGMPSLPVPMTLSLSAISHSVRMPWVRNPASKYLRLFLILVCTDPSFLLFSSKFLRNYHCLPVPSSCLLFFLFLFLFPSIRDQIQGLWHAKEVPRHCPTSPVPWSPPPRPVHFLLKQNLANCPG